VVGPLGCGAARMYCDMGPPLSDPKPWINGLI
jgi:hypothetical protein